MPVTLTPSTVKPEDYFYKSSRANKPGDILKVPIQRGIPHACKEIFQSTFTENLLNSRHVHPSSSSFVYAAINAYNYHHHLVIRPDDVWITILTQFSIYVNDHAEELRSMFVNHEGQKKLVVQAAGSRYTVDFGALTVAMGRKIEEDVKDPELRSWLIPDFSTTEDNDKIVASVIMMATLQKYYAYGMELCCGLPGVTLMGEKSDWETLLQKLEKLKTFGAETTQFADLLRPILERFVRCFDEPEAEDLKEFWQTIVNRQGGGSGPRYLGGWITAFCFWGSKGVQYNTKIRLWGRDAENLTIDDQVYGLVNDNHVIGGYAHVPVELNDNGAMFDTVMVAGMLAIEARPDVERDEKWEEENEKMKVNGEQYDGPQCSVIQPMAGWFIFDRKDPSPEDIWR
ncbi:hypothetical protein TWF694_000412 [Orbilia ellipsospora]|uniref:Uncharacterized protein n=1 Tax=Orbilia ellipsospora TaxID=2528407 RepID=A0AAV9XPE5_9PEZI